MDQVGAFEPVSLSIAGAIATITFERPAARNAMLLRSWCALSQLVADADHDPRVGVIVLRGAGEHFGAGNDIAAMRQLRFDPAAARDFGWAMAGAMALVERASKPVIAAIEGACFGASVALALAADIRLAAVDAHFAITPAKLGVVYLQSDLCRVLAAIGPGRARRMIFTAGTIDAVTAETIGLVDQVAHNTSFESALNELAGSILCGSARTMLHTKRMLRLAGGEPQAETEDSIGWFVDATQCADFAEGVDAFLAKRTPQFVR